MQNEMQKFGGWEGVKYATYMSSRHFPFSFVKQVAFLCVLRASVLGGEIS